ncbi:MAG TPA: chromate efflux transporter [Bacilli bacterium]|nr:chromate efflux transporter [Bacilli bacterium]
MIHKKRTLPSFLEVLLISLKLGLTSFGGPAAHLGFFRDEYVNRRKWLTEKGYADLVALCQFLPGPASSQVGIGIGFIRAGYLGAVASWIGFTLPSVVMLVLFAYLLRGSAIDTNLLHGLLIVAVAIVAHAVWGMAKTLAPDRPRATIAIIAAVMALVLPTVYSQIGIIVSAGLLGWFLFRNVEITTTEKIPMQISKKIALLFLVLFFLLLAILPIVRMLSDSSIVALFDSMYRAGSLVFGGGHVVLPLLQAEVVTAGMLSAEQFLAGYGAAQAVPGPLFTFSSYIGMASLGWVGALVATIAIFLPSFLLILGALPFWNWIRHRPAFQAALYGINAAVVGILLAALYDPVFTKAIIRPLDFCLALIAFGMLSVWKLPSWLVVLLIGSVGGLFSYL